jgi:ABC-type multidrug transport system ATPase subunit
VSEVIARKKTTYKADGVEMTPGQLLERLGFSSAHLSARVHELSGGQRRRLQFLLELLDEPNVLLLDEPTNDLDTEMLRAMEDLLDTWPGTLIVVSHDRYLLERITDQQYAIVGGEFRHLPGGVDEYIRLEEAISRAASSSAATETASAAETEAVVLRPGSKEHREAEKEQARLDKQMAALSRDIAQLDLDMASSDMSDHSSLVDLAERRGELARELEQLEMRWMELAELLER